MMTTIPNFVALGKITTNTAQDNIGLTIDYRLGNITNIPKKENENLIKITNSTTRNKCTININELGSYSVYSKSLLEEVSLFKNDAIQPINSDLINGYIFENGNIMCNQLEIENLEAGKKYTFYVFKGQKPILENLIKTITIYTKPDIIKLSKDNISAKEIRLKWNKINTAKEIQIYKNGKLYKTIPGNENSFKDKEIQVSKVYQYKIKAIYEDKEINKNSKDSNCLKIKVPDLLGLPAVTGECKTWANYQAVTMKSSPQYKLLNSPECYTDMATGIRMVDDCYCVALGSYYGSKIGQKYLIKLSSGNEFKAILCDQKADRHTDVNNQYAINNKDIIEFYIDRKYKPAAVGGSYSSLPQFSGAVISIEKI